MGMALVLQESRGGKRWGRCGSSRGCRFWRRGVLEAAVLVLVLGAGQGRGGGRKEDGCDFRQSLAAGLLHRWDAGACFVMGEVDGGTWWAHIYGQDSKVHQ
jgi:hypothetical protein